MAYKNPEDQRACRRRCYHARRNEINEYERNYRRGVKAEVLTHYGNGKLACVDCGFDNIWALSIDHINGDGAQLRRLGEPKGFILYCKLRRTGYPEGYQTLCANCQLIKKFENKEFAYVHNNK